LTSTFVGPLCLLFGFVGLIGLVVALMMRSALIYVAAAMAPIVWSVNVLPLFRGSARKLVQLTVALIVSKLAIVITLVVAVKLIANPTGDPNSASVLNDGAAAVGTLMTGFVCFLVAAVTPVVLYKVMPTVEGAAATSGIAGGWTRGATTAAHTALMVKSLGASTAASAATRAVTSQRGTTSTGPAATPSSPRGDVTGFGRSQPDTSPTAAAVVRDQSTSGSGTDRGSSGGAGSNRRAPTEPPRRVGDHDARSDGAGARDRTGTAS
jgi:type IV secretion system protein TrbL